MIFAEIPGVDKENVAIEVKDNVLTIQGERVADDTLTCTSAPTAPAGNTSRSPVPGTSTVPPLADISMRLPIPCPSTANSSSGP